MGYGRKRKILADSGQLAPFVLVRPPRLTRRGAVPLRPHKEGWSDKDGGGIEGLGLSLFFPLLSSSTARRERKFCTTRRERIFFSQETECSSRFDVRFAPVAQTELCRRRNAVENRDSPTQQSRTESETLGNTEVVTMTQPKNDEAPPAYDDVTNTQPPREPPPQTAAPTLDTTGYVLPEGMKPWQDARRWAELETKDGVLCSETGGVFCSSRGGFCCSDHGGVICSDFDGVICSDRAGVICSGNGGVVCSDNNGVCCSDHSGVCCSDHGGVCCGSGG